jgi:hypothetical protein
MKVVSRDDGNESNVIPLGDKVSFCDQLARGCFDVVFKRSDILNPFVIHFFSDNLFDGPVLLSTSDVNMIVKFIKKHMHVISLDKADASIGEIPKKSFFEQIANDLLDIFAPNRGTNVVDTITQYDKRGSVKFETTILQKKNFYFFQIGFGVGGLFFYRLHQSDVNKLEKFLDVRNH